MPESQDAMKIRYQNNLWLCLDLACQAAIVLFVVARLVQYAVGIGREQFWVGFAPAVPFVLVPPVYLLRMPYVWVLQPGRLGQQSLTGWTEWMSLDSIQEVRLSSVAGGLHIDGSRKRMFAPYRSWADNTATMQLLEALSSTEARLSFSADARRMVRCRELAAVSGDSCMLAERAQRAVLQGRFKSAARLLTRAERERGGLAASEMELLDELRALRPAV